MKFRIVHRNPKIKEIYGYLEVNDTYTDGDLYFSKHLLEAKKAGFILRMYYDRYQTMKAPKKVFWAWTEDRVCPAGRHNIDEILRGYNMKEYNALELMVKKNAECVMDDLKIERLPDTFDFLREVDTVKENENA